MKKLLEKISDVLEELETKSFIDGTEKRTAVRRLYNKFGNMSKGIFRDTDWRNVNRIFQAISKAGIDYTLMDAHYGRSQFDHSEDGQKSKVWKFEIKFKTKKGKDGKIFGRITAMAAGSVEDPWDKYDIALQFD